MVETLGLSYFVSTCNTFLLIISIDQQKLLTIIDEQRDEMKYSFPKKVESLLDVDDQFSKSRLYPRTFSCLSQ